jgi:hypothetical protein
MLNNIQAHNHTVHGYLQTLLTDQSQGVSTVQPDACLHSHNSHCYVTHTITYIVMTTVIALMIQFTAAISKRTAVVACITLTWHHSNNLTTSVWPTHAASLRTFYTSLCSIRTQEPQLNIFRNISIWTLKTEIVTGD